ncbi:diiron oxygenase [Subtercola endophyticus]|uniref:diiron oxygenase n=1 Tax=Subtercola endophyticus TaxID=2895559 RepID=UPI001E58CA3A|nr:diiron oxygenase [Subtercola endophyticus]UFS59669.1 diiron oxygenase [Subtercola endophyticus]
MTDTAPTEVETNEEQRSGASRFAVWARYFEANVSRHERLDALIPWSSRSTLPGATVVALARSLQRFELGESGEGKNLRAKARRLGDASYDAALTLFIAEEQKHSALFGAALTRFGADRLTSHWSDAAFVVLRRLMGLRTEITLFLIAETTAMGYFDALGRSADPVIRGVARRVTTDEIEHIRFQIDQLRVGFETTPRVGRMLAALAASVVAVAAATVVAIDHGPAMRACGLGRGLFWRRALGTFGRAARSAFLLDGDAELIHGPSVTPAALTNHSPAS